MKPLTASLALVAVAITARADVDPVYSSWAQHGIGTSVTTRSISEMIAGKSDVETTHTLVEKTSDKVVIEITRRGTKPGAPRPVTRMQIKAQAGPQGRGGPKQDVKESVEIITVSGKQYKAKVTETTGREGSQTIWNKVWTSPDFPGLTIKSILKMEGPQKLHTTVETLRVTIK